MCYEVEKVNTHLEEVLHGFHVKTNDMVEIIPLLL